jgi:hypothetical protein
MKATVVATILLLACVVAGVSVAAKGTTVKLVISGGHLDSPVDITGKDVVFANPWGDGFVADWKSIPPPPTTSPRYEVSFYEELGPRNVKMMYIVEYSRDVHGRGAIYLPGHGDPRYRLNVSTILRDEKDGQWFPASDEWDRIVGSHLPRISSAR